VVDCNLIALEIDIHYGVTSGIGETRMAQNRNQDVQLGRQSHPPPRVTHRSRPKEPFGAGQMAPMVALAAAEATWPASEFHKAREELLARFAARRDGQGRPGSPPPRSPTRTLTPRPGRRGRRGVREYTWPVAQR
jgi:hypothetical protein